MRAAIVPAFLTLLLTAPAGAQSVDPGRRLNVAFVVWDGMELIESMGPAHVFAFAPGMDEYTVGATREPVTSAFVTLVPDHTFADAPTPDVIVVPGGSIWTPMNGAPYREWLQEHVPQAALTLSVCNSAILLADLGLLDGKEATCGPANLDDLMLLGEDVRAFGNRRWVHSGNVLTSDSYLGGLDAAIYAVRALRGPEAEEQVLRWSNYDGDLSRYDALHAEPGVVPTSRRREVVRVLLAEGVDAALARYEEWVASGRTPYSPPVDRFEERDLFQWMAWGNQQGGRHEASVSLCTFMARLWPDAEGHARLGEALVKAGRHDEAVASLLESLAIDPMHGTAQQLAHEVLARGKASAERAEALRASLRAADGR